MVCVRRADAGGTTESLDSRKRGPWRVVVLTGAVLLAGCSPRPSPTVPNDSPQLGLTPEQNAERLRPVEKKLRERLPPGFAGLDVNAHNLDHELVFTVSYRKEGYNHDTVRFYVRKDGPDIQMRVFDRFQEGYLADFGIRPAEVAWAKKLDATDEQFAWIKERALAVSRAAYDSTR